MAVLGVACALAGGCSWVSGGAHAGDRGGSCLPSELTVTPTTVPVGGTVTLSSAPFACDSSYPPGKTYQLTLLVLTAAR